MCNHNKDNNNYRTDIFQRPTSEMWRPQLNKERLWVPAATVVCSGNDLKCSGCSISVLLYWKITYLYKYIYIYTYYIQKNWWSSAKFRHIAYPNHQWCLYIAIICHLATRLPKHPVLQPNRYRCFSSQPGVTQESPLLSLILSLVRMNPH